MVQPDPRELPAAATFGLDAFGAADYELDLRTGAIRHSPRLSVLFGYPAGHALTLEECRAAYHPDDRAAMVGVVAETLGGGGRFYQREFRILMPGGGVRWVLSRGEVIRGADGRPAVARGAALDITDRKHAELAVRASEEKYRTLFDTIDEGFCLLDVVADEQGRLADLTFREVNRAFARQTGLADVVGTTVGAILPDLGLPWLELAARVWETGEAVRAEDYVASLGRWYTVRLSRVGGEGSRTLAVVFDDITERARAEDALRASEARFRTLADTVPQLIWTAGPDGALGYVNRRWADAAGLALDSALGDGWLAAVHPDDRAGAAARWREAVASGGVFEHEYRLRGADGVYRWHLGRAAPLRDEGGRVAGWFGAATDIEALRRAAATQHERDVLRRLAEAQEEERLRLARDLHDQLGQLITGLQLGLRGMQRAAEGTAAAPLIPPLEALALELAREAHRIALDLRPTALDDVGLAPALELLVAAWGAETGVAAAFESLGLDGQRLPRAVEVVLYRVVQEALTNVRKHAGAASVSVILERRGALAVAVVEDDGRGFDPDWAPGGGGRAPLGLLGMRERVAQVGGALEIESSPGRGTTVFVRVPLGPGESGRVGEWETR